MDYKLKLKAKIKFCNKFGKTDKETFQMILQAYSNEAMSCVQYFEWHACFKIGRISLEENERSQ